MKDLGYEDFEVDNRTVFPFLGGENAAFQRMEHYFLKPKKLVFIKKLEMGFWESITARNFLLGLQMEAYQRDKFIGI